MEIVLLIYIICTMLSLLFTKIKEKRFFGKFEYKFILFSIFPIINVGYFCYISFSLASSWIYYTYHIIIQILLPYLLGRNKKEMSEESNFRYNFQYLIFGVYILTHKGKPIKTYNVDTQIYQELIDKYNLKTFTIKTTSSIFDIGSTKEVFYCVGKKKTKMILEYIHSYELAQKLSK